MAFARTAKTNEITPGTIREFQVEGKAVALANIGGKYYAINNTCLHRGGPLGQGTMNGEVVTCPWHGWQYNVITGKVVQNPADPHILGIRNLTPAPWSATFPDGTMKEVPPQIAVPINLGLQLNIAGTRAEIVA